MIDEKLHSQLNDFLAGSERKAYIMAHIATKNHHDALDIVQDAMSAFVAKYAEKPAADWSPLFYRIVQNRIRDFYRRAQVRQAFSWFSSASGTDPQQLIEDTPGNRFQEPLDQLQQEDLGQHILSALETLSVRQQQAFLLRHWQGLSVRETACAMRCSEGSVKAHVSRALINLRSVLQEQEGLNHE